MPDAPVSKSRDFTRLRSINPRDSARVSSVNPRNPPVSKSRDFARVARVVCAFVSAFRAGHSVEMYGYVFSVAPSVGH